MFFFIGLFIHSSYLHYPWTFFDNFIFLVWSALCVFLGRETNFSFFNEAIQFYTGRKEDENIDPFGR
jgi:hypothetical protein